MIRIGHGYDVHAFTTGNAITLGGITIPHKFGVLAHSDGDVVLHALCDALLGALALGDIGEHFPDTDERFKQVDSVDLLKNVYAKVRKLGWELGNADITVIAESPKLGMHKTNMAKLIASTLDVDASQLSIKAKTAEKLGALGREEGIAAHAVVLLTK